MHILITGGCGFIGSNFIRYILSTKPNIHVINLDKLTYAGNPANLSDIEKKFPRHYRFVKGDICDPQLVESLFQEHDLQWILNFAAETHVDRSILGPDAFIKTNIQGTYILLEAARKHWLHPGAAGSGAKRFLQISTDEVYGSLGAFGCFTETTPYDPSSPYSASKAAADHLAKSYFRTFGLPVLVTHSSNNYGPYQFPEKLIPLMIHNALSGLALPIYGDGRNVRDWVYVGDHCEALLRVLEKGRPGESYNIGGRSEKQNKEVVAFICDYLDRKLGSPAAGPRQRLMKFVTDRPGHDQRYAIDIAKLHRETGWQPEVPFEQGLQKTIDWYLENAAWVQAVRDGSYLKYYEKQYGKRLTS
ncbi:MAG: dTDP-glucose 4,6-dehydratase [Desulfobacteraceae bacterium]|nr:MAG: dTDP-glucose 4,6-dehydratase [Desulfobacteraceae bacterium]